MRGDALLLFKNISGPSRKNLGEFVIVFHGKDVKPESMATVKYKFPGLVFNTANQKLSGL